MKESIAAMDSMEYRKLISRFIAWRSSILALRERVWKLGIDLRREYASLYSLRWEIERTFSILKEILQCENIWYTKNRDYGAAMGLKAIAYNPMVISNIEAGEKPREIMKIVAC